MAVWVDLGIEVDGKKLASAIERAAKHVGYEVTLNEEKQFSLRHELEEEHVRSFEPALSVKRGKTLWLFDKWITIHIGEFRADFKHSVLTLTCKVPERKYWRVDSERDSAFPRNEVKRFLDALREELK